MATYKELKKVNIEAVDVYFIDSRLEEIDSIIDSNLTKLDDLMKARKADGDTDKETELADIITTRIDQITATLSKYIIS